MDHRRCATWIGLSVALAFALPAAAQAPPPSPPYTGPTSGVVRLPWDDFRRLVERLRSLEEPAEQPPPVDTAITAAVYRVTVDAEERQATVAAEIDLVVLRQSGWVEVPLLPDSAALESFSIDGRSATVAHGEGSYRLIAQAGFMYYGQPTARKLALTWRVNVTRDGGPHGIDVPLVDAPVSRLEIAVPRPDQEVRVEPGGVVVGRAVDPAATKVTALLPRAPAAAIRWSDRSAPAQEDPLRAVADLVHRVSFQRYVVSGEVALSVRVERGSFEAVVVRFPKEAEGIRASGDFSVDTAPEGDAAQLATVHAGYARREDASFVLRYELTRNVGRIVPPDIKIVKLVQAGQDREIVRQAGFLELYAAEGMEVRQEGPPAGAEPCDVSEVPGGTELTGTPVMAFRTSGQPYATPVTVTRHEERAVLASAAQAAYLALVVNREGKAVGDLTLSVQNNERQFVGIWLPRDAQLWATFVRGLPVKPSGENEWVMIPVPRSTIGPGGVPETFAVEVIYYQDVPRIDGIWGSGSLEVPRVDLLVSRFDMDVYVPPEFRYFDFGGDAKARLESVGPVDALGRVATDDAGLPPGYYVATGEEGELNAADRLATAPAPPAVQQRDAGAPARRGLVAANEIVDQSVSLPGRADEDAKEEERRLTRKDRGEEKGGEAAGLPLSGRLSAAAPDSTRGLLPIRIDVPREGVVLSFRRSLVEPKAGTTISFRYQARPVLALFPWLGALAGLLLAFAVARAAHRSAARRRFSPGAVAPVAFAVGLALAVLLGTWLAARLGGVGWALFGGLLAYAVAVGAWFLCRWWKAQRAAALPPPGGPPAPPPPPEAPPAPAAPGVSP